MRAGAGLAVLVLAFGLACGGGEALPPTDKAPTDKAPTPAEGDDDDDEGDDGGTVRDRAARDDCRLGLKGVVAGMPGWPGGDHKAHPGPLEFKTAPRADARVVMALDRTGAVSKLESDPGAKPRPVCTWAGRSGQPACLSAEFAYEGYGLPVFQERRGWVQVAVGPGDAQPEAGYGCRKRVWLELEAPLTFLDAEKLIEGAKMTHTLPNWDGVLFDGPDGAPRTSGEEGQVWIRTKRTARAGGRLWLEATVIDTHCDTKVERTTGWIPVTDRDGRFQVWFDTAC